MDVIAKLVLSGTQQEVSFVEHHWHRQYFTLLHGQELVCVFTGLGCPERSSENSEFPFSGDLVLETVFLENPTCVNG